MRLSVVIPYYNRRDKLINVLESFTPQRTMETIIVDDGSDKEHEIYDLRNKYKRLNIRIIRLERAAVWRGACVAYNQGFSVALGETIIINSSECVHIGNVIGYVYKNWESNLYMAFATLMGTKEMNIRDYKYDPNSFLNQVKEHKTWWSIHSEIKNFIPYCAVISRKNMHILGGYDERFRRGIGYDDYDFTHRVRNLGLKMICIDNPFVFHQWHKPTDYPNTINLDLLNRLNKEEPNRIKAND